MRVFSINLGKLPDNVNVEDVMVAIREQYGNTSYDELRLGYHVLQLEDRAILIELIDSGGNEDILSETY